MTRLSKPRFGTIEIFLCIIVATVMIASFGAVIYGFREVLLIIDEPDPVEQWIFTAASNIMFGLAGLLFIVLTGSLVWKYFRH